IPRYASGRKLTATNRSANSRCVRRNFSGSTGLASLYRRGKIISYRLKDIVLIQRLEHSMWDTVLGEPLQRRRGNQKSPVTKSSNSAPLHKSMKSPGGVLFRRKLDFRELHSIDFNS